MKIWAKIITNHKIQNEVVQEFASARPVDLAGWTPVVASLAKPLDLAVPIMLPKHVSELKKFSRTVFKPADFMESVDFDSFEIEIFPERKKAARVEYRYF